MKYAMTKYLLPLMVSILGFSAAAQAQTATTTIEGRVLIETENLKLVQLPDHRQAVYYTQEDGTVKLFGKVGVIRAGTEFYHWGNATPEQAEAWDKAGQISAELLNRLRADKNFGALGGGFYASLSRVDSMNYGNVQIVLRMPREMKILSEVVPYGISGEQWAKIIPQLDVLGISALQNGNTPTWFNIIDANALTREHVAKARDWKKFWGEANNKRDILTKLPDIFLEPTMQIEVNRYLLQWKALASSDPRRIYAAFKYFTSIKDIQGMDFSLARIGGQYKEAVLPELMKSYESMTPYARANFLRSENLRIGPLYQDFLKVALLDPSSEVRMAILQGLQGRLDSQAMTILNDNLHHENSGIRHTAYQALQGRHDSAALEILKQGTNDPDIQVRARVYALISTFNSQESLDLLKKGMMDPEPNVRTSIIQSIQNRTDQGAFALLKIGIRDSNDYVRSATLNAAIARKGTRSLDIFNAVMNGSNISMKVQALRLLDGREDADSLKVLAQILKGEDRQLKAAALFALGKRKGNYVHIFAAALKDRDTKIQLAAMSALSGKTDKKSLELIMAAVNDPSTEMRNMAINALAGRQDKESVLILKQAVRDPEVIIRYTALNSAKSLSSADLLDIVKIAMTDTEDNIRQRAITSLQGRTDDIIFEFLKSVSVNDPTQSVRYAAIPQIPNFKTPAAMDFLKDLAANSPDVNVKNYATQQLGQLAAQGLSNPTSSDPAAPRVLPLQKFDEKLGRLKTEIQEAARTPPRCESVFRH